MNFISKIFKKNKSYEVCNHDFKPIEEGYYEDKEVCKKCGKEVLDA